MEKISNELVNLFSNLPTEIQQHIAAYLDAPALGFFAQSNKWTLKNVLPLLLEFKAMFPLRLTAKESSTYISQANQLFVCGNNFSPQDHSTFTAVSWPEDRERIQQIITGGYHTIVLTDANKLWVYGKNNYGQLGLGHTENCRTFTAVPLPSGVGRVKQVTVGWSHTLMLTEDHQLWACGENFYDQLGLGHTKNCYTFTTVPLPSEMGKVKQVVAGGIYTLVITENDQL